MPLRISEAQGAVTVDILVKPRSARAATGPIHDDRLRVAVTSAPVDGEANAAVIDILSRSLSVPKSAIEIIRGTTGRRKTIRIHGTTLAAVTALGDG